MQIRNDLGSLTKPVPAQTRDHGIGCVVLSCFESEFRFWAYLCRLADIRMIRADTLEEADFLLNATASSVLLVDVVFLDGTWKDAVAMVAGSHPRVTSVVIADEIDSPFVADAFSYGALSVCWKPICLHRLRRLIRWAHEVSEERALWLRN